MKKALLFIVAFVLVTSVVCKAQSEPNRVQSSYPNKVKLSYGVIGAGSVGSFTASYRHLNKTGRWGFGGDISYTGIQNDPFRAIGSNFFSIMPVVECYYLKSGICRLYGNIGLGFMVSDSGWAGISAQFNPIAVRVGTNKIAGFVELGFGTKGIINLGIEIGL